MHRLSGDRLFASLVAILVVAGVAIFLSAALGLLARAGVSPWHIAITQILLGLLPGIACLVCLRLIPPHWLARAVIPAYIIAILGTLLVFVPGIGADANGATRWINLGFTTVQPAEFLKFAVILMLAAYLAHARKHITDIRHGLLPFMAILGVPAIILIMQPNTSTTLIMGVTGVALYFLAGAPWRDFLIILAIAVVGLTLLVFMRPYLMNRVLTFIEPSRSPTGSGYQIQQSLIAIGSGGVLGRGFGQSVEKFNYLPEPVGDSVFAVYGEEFGFLGTTILVLLFLLIGARGLIIASEAPNLFGTLAVTGFTLIITLSAFLNIGAMLGVLPLTGLPLPFVSQGGTALLVNLAAVGVILNIAARRRKTRT